MKHISTYLAKHQDQVQEHVSQMRLFAVQPSKGSHEWESLQAVRGDRVDGYPVRLPRALSRKAIVTREPHNVLRIAYMPHFQPSH